MSRKIRMIITFVIAITMIINVNLSYANRQSGSIHLIKDGVMENGNNPVFQSKQDVFVKVSNFIPGEYEVMVKSPGSKGTLLGSGNILVPENGMLTFNLYQLVEFDDSDNEAGIYTVTVGDNKLKNFKLMEKNEPIDDEPTEQEKRVDDLITIHGFIPIANGYELDRIRNSYPEGELFGQGSKWEGQYLTNGLMDKYVLVDDIDLKDFSNWIPIGDLFNQFQGILDGNGHRIENLSIDNDEDYVGLFSIIRESEVRDLTLLVKSIRGRSLVGSISGVARNSLLSNVRVIGDDSAYVEGHNSIGGVVGQSLNTRIENTHNEVNVSAISGVGGIASYQNESFYSGNMNIGIFNSTNRGIIIGRVYVGGIISSNDGLILENVINYGRVTITQDLLTEGSYRYIGGIAGYNTGLIDGGVNYGSVDAEILSSDSEFVSSSLIGGINGSNYGGGKILNSSNYGNVTGNSTIGGIIGYNEYDSTIGPENHVINVVNYGSITGMQGIGGIIGFSVGVIEKALNMGSVSGDNHVGGITGNTTLGLIYDKVSISQAVNTGNISGRYNVGGISASAIQDRIQDSYNMGIVSGVYNIGGILGYSRANEIRRVYSSGDISGLNSFEAIIGDIFDNQVLEFAYYNSDMVIAPNTNGGIPLSNDDMAKSQSFIGLDFVEVWKIYQDETYPFFQWHEDLYIPWKINLGE